MPWPNFSSSPTNTKWIPFQPYDKNLPFWSFFIFPVQPNSVQSVYLVLVTRDHWGRLGHRFRTLLDLPHFEHFPVTVRVNAAAKSGAQRWSVLREEPTGFIPNPTSVAECFGSVGTGSPLWGLLNQTMTAPPRNLAGLTGGLKSRQRRRRRLFPLLLRRLAGGV